MYSISSRASFTRIEKFHRQIQRVKESSQSSSPSHLGSPLSTSLGSRSYGPAPVMLVGNKCDRVTEREVSTQEGSALAKKLGCNFVETSAKNCVNVEKAFFDVVRQLRLQRQKQQVYRSSERKKGYISDRPNHTNNAGSERQYRPSKAQGKKRNSLCVFL